MTTVLLDTHALYWHVVDPDRLGRAASVAIDSANDLAVAAITWYELAWLVERGRLSGSIPLIGWLHALSAHARTVPLTPAVAGTAAALPASFPSDPADRLIVATAIEHGWQLVSKDGAIHAHAHLTQGVIW